MLRENVLQNIAAERSDIEESIFLERSAVEPITSVPYVVLSPNENPIKFTAGLSGSLTKLAGNSSYLVAGDNVEIVSSSNGSISISAFMPSFEGVDGDVQFKDGDMDFGADPSFKFEKTTKTLIVPNLSSSLTRLVDDSSYLLSQGLVTVTSGSSITIARLLSDDISYEVWKSYVPSITSTETMPTPPSDSTSVGKFIYSSGLMKLIFNFSSRDPAGGNPGTGTYLISMPSGYEIDSDVVPFATTSEPLNGISLGSANISLDAVGGGGAWAIVPISVSQMMLVGKSPSDATVSTWGSGKFPLGTGTDYRVSFSVTIPAKIAPSYDGTIFIGGDLTINPGTNVYLYASVFNRPGTYVLFDYSTPGASFAGGQNVLNSNIVINPVDLPPSISSTIPPTLTDDVSRKRVLLTLWGDPTNGKTFVGGDLAFIGATTMTLSSMLYGNPGTYELFEVGGTISGLQYLKCISESGFVCGAPFQDGALVKVTLF